MCMVPYNGLVSQPGCVSQCSWDIGYGFTVNLTTIKWLLIMDECIALVLKFSNTSHYISFKELNSE